MSVILTPASMTGGTCVDGVRNYTCNCASFPEDGVLTPDENALTWVSYIGATLSVISLTVTIITYLGERSVQSTYVDPYLILCLILAQ